MLQHGEGGPAAAAGEGRRGGRGGAPHADPRSAARLFSNLCGGWAGGAGCTPQGRLGSPGFGFKSELRLQWPEGCPTLPLPRFPCLPCKGPWARPPACWDGSHNPLPPHRQTAPRSPPGEQGAQKPAVLVGSLETAQDRGSQAVPRTKLRAQEEGGKRERAGTSRGSSRGRVVSAQATGVRGVKCTPEVAAGPLDSESVPGCRRLLGGPDLGTEPLAPITIPRATLWSSGSHHGATLGRRVTNSPVGRGDRAGSFRGSLHICILALTPPRSQSRAPSPRPT